MNDVHEITGCLKSFLRGLADSVIPQAFYADMLAASRMHDCTDMPTLTPS